MNNHRSLVNIFTRYKSVRATRLRRKAREITPISAMKWGVYPILFQPVLEKIIVTTLVWAAVSKE